MRSDASLQIFTLGSEEIMGHLMRSDGARSDGPKSVLENLTTRPVGFSNRKILSVFIQVKIQLSRAWDTQHAAAVQGTYGKQYG